MSTIAEKYKLLLSQNVAIGNVINTEKDTPNKLGKYQEYEHGIMFYTPTFDACLLTDMVMAKWKSASVANTLTHNGSKIQDYLGFPVADTAKNNDGTEVCMFERGMIICRTDGNSFVVYGDIFTKYLSNRAKEVGSPFPNWMGYPTQDVFIGPFNGLVGKFENADIYWHPSLGAFEVHGDIRNRYNSLGQAGSLLGYPTSDEHDIVKDSVTVGRANNFQAGTIYWSEKTGAWEVHGSIGATYLKEYKGPIGDLGFPISNETNSPTDLYRFNNFERGVLTWQKSTSIVRKITKLNLLVQSIETTNDADTGSSDDPYLVINIKPIMPINGFNPIYRLPNKSNGNDGISDGGNNQFYYDGTSTISVQDDNKTVCSIPITDGNQKISLTIETWDYDSGANGNDDFIGRFTAVYDIDTLWDTTQPIAIARNPNAFAFNGDKDEDGDYINGSAKITFNFDPDDFIIDPNSVNFRRDLWWNIDNYDVERISKEVYAATFSDVEQGESAFFHLFNAIFYDAVYKSLGKPGVCFGMCVEAVYALKKRSISNQPISQYNSQLVNSPFGVDDKGTPFPDEARNNSFQLRHGYQLGGDLVQYYISQLFDGEIWNPVLSFNRSKEMFDRGDFPVMVISPGALDPGHAVLPYSWDSSNPQKLIIHVANPNSPISKDSPGMNIITILNEPGKIEFIYEHEPNNTWTGREGAFKGGRMFPIPYSKFSTVPRTPALEIGIALLALAPLALLGGPILLPVGLLK